MKKSGKKVSWKKIFLFTLLTFAFVCIGLFIFIYSYSNTLIAVPKTKRTITTKALTQDTLPQVALEFYKAIIDTNDTNIEIIKISHAKDTVVHFGIDKFASKDYKKVYDGERINIALTGVDARLGSKYKHADANHVFSFLPDLGKIEIISIPRDTEADAGYPDTTTFNKLTVCRASKGRAFYLQELARIAGLDKIHYYVEFGFSQAMGILEWLGYKDAGSQLQVLRSRKGFVQDDFQRTYNQAQFMKQMIFLNFDKFSGIFGDVMLSSGLSLVDSNIDKAKIRALLSRLKINGLTESISNITVNVKPSLRLNFNVYDFSDPLVVKEMQNKVNEYFNHSFVIPDSVQVTVNNKVETLLEAAIIKAEADSTLHPTLVINRLRTYFDQRAWLQIRSRSKRDSIREKIHLLLSNAYDKKGEQSNAKNVRDIIAKEKKFFKFCNVQIDKEDHSSNINTLDTLSKY